MAVYSYHKRYTYAWVCLNRKQLICGPQRHQSVWINWAAVIDKRTLNPISSGGNWRQPACKSRKCKRNYISHCNLIGWVTGPPAIFPSKFTRNVSRSICSDIFLYTYINIYIIIYTYMWRGSMHVSEWSLVSVIFCHNWVYQLTPMWAMVGSLTLTVLPYPTTIYIKEKLAYLYKESSNALMNAFILLWKKKKKKTTTCRQFVYTFTLF